MMEETDDMVPEWNLTVSLRNYQGPINDKSHVHKHIHTHTYIQMTRLKVGKRLAFKWNSTAAKIFSGGIPHHNTGACQRFEVTTGY